jgi:hypothetical protein
MISILCIVVALVLLIVALGWHIGAFVWDCLKELTLEDVFWWRN